MKRLKILFRKNLKMTDSKLAAQCVHAALGMPTGFTNAYMSVIVLGVSDKKFNEMKELVSHPNYVVRDAGYTEVPPGTETCLAFLEDDPRADEDK